MFDNDTIFGKGMLLAKFNSYPTSIAEPNNFFETDILVFPNPAHDIISFSSNFIQTSVSIHNILGEKVYSGNFEINLKISFLSSGIYLLKLSKAERSYFKKFAKE